MLLFKNIERIKELLNLFDPTFPACDAKYMNHLSVIFQHIQIKSLTFNTKNVSEYLTTEYYRNFITSYKISTMEIN